MRSFFEFVSCCLMTPGVVFRNEEEVVVVAAEEGTTSRREETKSLTPPKVVALTKKKKRVRVGTPGSATPEWKPSLYVISEDNVMAEKREKTDQAVVNRAVRRKSSSGSRSKVHVRTNSDDIGRNQVEMAIPTFSAAPFMF